MVNKLWYFLCLRVVHGHVKHWETCGFRSGHNPRRAVILKESRHFLSVSKGKLWILGTRRSVHEWTTPTAITNDHNVIHKYPGPCIHVSRRIPITACCDTAGPANDVLAEAFNVRWWLVGRNQLPLGGTSVAGCMNSAPWLSSGLRQRAEEKPQERMERLRWSQHVVASLGYAQIIQELNHF